MSFLHHPGLEGIGNWFEVSKPRVAVVFTRWRTQGVPPNRKQSQGDAHRIAPAV